jgi:D-mannonate dehydratase
MTSGDEHEPAKRPTDAPETPPTVDELLRMIEQTHVETRGLKATLVESKAASESVKASADALKDAVERFVNVMSEVNQRQNKIEGRLSVIEKWHRKQGHELAPDGTDG